MSQPKSAHRSDSLCARDPGLGLRSPRKLRSEMLPGSHKTKKIRKPRVLPLAMDFARGSYHLKDTVQISNPICVLRIEMQIAPSPGNMPKNRKPRYLQLRMPIQRDNWPAIPSRSQQVRYVFCESNCKSSFSRKRWQSVEQHGFSESKWLSKSAPRKTQKATGTSFFQEVSSVMRTFLFDFIPA